MRIGDKSFGNAFAKPTLDVHSYARRLLSQKSHHLFPPLGGFARKPRKTHGKRTTCFFIIILYVYAPFSSKIFPFSVAVGGFSLCSKPMVCVTAASLVTLFYITMDIFTHTQNKNEITVGTCRLPFVFISGKKQSFAYALTKPALRVLSTRNVCLRQKSPPSPLPWGGGFSLCSKPMENALRAFYIIRGTFVHTQKENRITVGTCRFP